MLFTKRSKLISLVLLYVVLINQPLTNFIPLRENFRANTGIR